MIVIESRDNSIGTKLTGFNTISNLLYGLNEEENIGLKIKERKRRRGDPTLQGTMDIDVGLNIVGPQSPEQQSEVGIFNGDLAASSQTFSAKLPVQASQSQ